MSSVISLSAVRDGMRNLMTGLGGSNDKGAQNRHYFGELSDSELIALYCSSWVAGQVVDIPASDATKKWRKWTDEDDKIEAVERRFGVQKKIKQALIRGRLFGGGALLIGTADVEIAEPLDPSTVGLGDLRFLTVFDRIDLAAGRIGDDPTDEFFGVPRYYEVTTPQGIRRIHPSRLVLFRGQERPSRSYATSGWGLSVLQRAVESVRHHDGAMADSAGLIKEAKIDVLKTPGLTERIQDPNFEQAMKNRLGIMQNTAGNLRKVIIDKEEVWETHGYTFAGVGDMMDRFARVVCGAADVPMTRLFGTSPGGLNSTGDGDLANYYDAVADQQKNEIGPAMQILDRVLIRSSLGDEPVDVNSKWNPVREMSEKEIAEITGKNAETAERLGRSQLFETEALSEAAAKLMERTGVAGLNDLEGRNGS